MFYLQYRVLPANNHPEADLLGEAMVCCWIERDTLEEADASARADMTERHWIVIEREMGDTVSEDDFADDEEFLDYYHQAVTDGEVFVYNQSPRYPVYWITAAVEEELSKEAAEAHYFLCGDSLTDDAEDVYDPAFWKGANARAAMKAAREALTEAGWEVKSITAQRPVGRTDLAEVMLKYYDEAEAEGACLVFMHEGEAAGGEPE